MNIVSYLLRILLVALICCSSLIMHAQVGIGVDDPQNALHIKPIDLSEDPIRIEGINELMQGDSAFLVMDPTTGIIRYLTMKNLVEYISSELEIEENELQTASEVPLFPTLDMTNDGVEEENVQAALESIQEKIPKGTFKSYGEARAAGLNNGDSFYADPRGVFGCSGCILTLFAGMD